jgi:hypothetical protein
MHVTRHGGDAECVRSEVKADKRARSFYPSIEARDVDLVCIIYFSNAFTISGSSLLQALSNLAFLFTYNNNNNNNNNKLNFSLVVM